MWVWLLLGLSASFTYSGLIYVLAILPEEKTQGIVQKIFYFHVPSAFTMYGFLVLGMLMAISYLINKRRIWDQISKAAMLTACLSAFLVIFSGPVWAKPIWGVWWTWDPRLTTSFVVFILLLAYVMARRILEDRDPSGQRAAVVGAILSILAVLDIPLIHLSVKLWRGLHPSVLENRDGLPPEFMKGLEIMILSCFLLASLICWSLFRYYKLKDDIYEIRMKSLQSS
ncbi:MAG: cytochrome C biogenesis protein CcmC [Deltaproteobacteria bacterium CG11_big_fil_rev_8_21_14_0_20_45_16]|nr:MAG: cytochrome C biogenesis protein CcmC [Deltaproteobacteria bacterium CG11_big_fil_rev_8_21_14_0_20_45_16]